MVLVAAGQPLFTEDAWWYLSMGEAYLQHGPWIDADPLLHTAEGPPAPAAWLFAVALSSIERATGFTGLRVAHALAVGLILALSWTLLRRVAQSRCYASAGTALFAMLAAYRLFQLRPHLFSIAAALVLVWLLVEERDGPSGWRIAAAALLCGVWANVHAAFVLGPLLASAAIAGVVLDRLWRRQGLAGAAPRLGRLTLALALLLLASAANPEGFGPHLLYFAAGGATPDLALVADEWASFGLFRLPVANLPPSPLGWGLVWALLVLSGMAVASALRRAAREAAPLDPALIGIAAASFVALASAVRFAWLGFFPLLLLGQALRARVRARQTGGAARAWAAALGALVLVAAFARFGAWPMISRGVARSTYAQPYPATKYYAHAVWFLRDAGLEGNLFNDYSRGNFLGYWLAPRLRVFVNGSLNLPRDAMQAAQAIARRGWQSETPFLELLDRYRVDVFFGTGVPEQRWDSREELGTTTHLENTPGWKAVFRNIRSAVYLRVDDTPRSRVNLERVSAYYAREGVPFDPGVGFDTSRAMREAPRWAFEHAVAPAHLDRLESAAASFDPTRRQSARARLASIYLALGLYDRSASLDRGLLGGHLAPVAATRRLLWGLLQQGRTQESLEVAERLEGLAPVSDTLSALLIASARRCAVLPGQQARALAAATPVFTRIEARQLFAGYREPEIRLRRR